MNSDPCLDDLHDWNRRNQDAVSSGRAAGTAGQQTAKWGHKFIALMPKLATGTAPMVNAILYTSIIWGVSAHCINYHR